MIALPNFLEAHSNEVRMEFGALWNEEKNAPLAGHVKAKDDKENIPMGVSLSERQGRLKRKPNTLPHDTKRVAVGTVHI